MFRESQHFEKHTTPKHTHEIPEEVSMPELGSTVGQFRKSLSTVSTLNSPHTHPFVLPMHLLYKLDYAVTELRVVCRNVGWLV